MEGLDFAVTLTDQMSGPAQQAAQSLSSLTKSAHETHGGLSELTGGFLKTVEPAEVLKGAFEGVSKGIQSMVAGIRSGDAKEAIAGVTETFAGLAQTLDLVVPGLGQVAAALVKVIGGFVGLTAGLVQSGAELALEATQGKLAMIDMFAALGGGVAVGEQTEAMLGDLSEEIGITKDALAPLTKSFMAMGIEGTDALRRVTLAAASAQAIMGDPAAAHSFETLTKKIQVAVQTGQGLKIPAKGLGSLADMGIRVDDVAKRMNVSTATLANQLKAGTVNASAFGDALQEALIEKGAGPLQRMGSSLGNLKKMFSQSIEDLFEDMGDATAPFLAQVKDLFSVFSQSTNSGKAMKAGIGGAFTFVFQMATKAILPIKHLFLDAVIWSLQTYIHIKAHWSQIKPVFLAVGAAISFAWDNLRLFVETVFAGINALVDMWSALTNIGKRITEFTNAAWDAGAAFVDGLVGGIKGGFAKVGEAASDLGAAAMKGLKDFLGIASPSKVGFSLGGFTAQGVAGGLTAGEGQVSAAARDVGQVAASGIAAPIQASDYAGAGAGGDGGRAAASAGGDIGPITIQITAPNGVTNALELTETAIALIFERIALQRGVT